MSVELSLAAGPDCHYPLFRSKFFASAHWAGPGADAASMHAARGGPPDGGGGGQAAPSSSSGGHHLQRPNLKTLDLKSLPREDGPPSETQLRRQKYLFFEKQCSRVQDALPLFLSGDFVARNKAILDENGITHVVNCVGFVSKEYFKGELQYRTLYLQDTPAEDILCVLYDTFDFIDRALRQGGHVLVHCSQGVSRSATIVIAYLMWRTGKTYDEVFAQVKSRRGVTNPNIGFTCQMLQWQKRQRSAPTRTRLYRIAPHCSHAPTYLVPKIVTPPKKYPNNTYRELDPRGAFVIHTPSRIYVWRGAACPPAYARAAEHHANLLLAYETYTGVPLVVLDQGDEDDGFMELMDPDMLDPEQERINARRASITGDVVLMTPSALASLDAMDTSDSLSSVGGNSAPVSVDLAPAAANAGSTAMDVSAEQVDIPRHAGLPDAPSLDTLAPTTVHSGSSAGHGALPSSTSLTQLPGRQQLQQHQQPYAQTQPGSRSQGQQQHLPPVSTIRHNSSSGRLCNSRWRPAEVEEYSDEYTLYLDAMRKGAGGDTSSDSTLGVRMSYDALYIGGDCGTSGPYGGRPLSALMGHTQHLDDSVRPESPASVEGRMKKYRRGTSEYGQAPSDKSKRLFPSLHTSIDEDNFNC